MIPATSKQIETLENLGFTGNTAELNIKTASELITTLIAQRKQESKQAIENLKQSTSLETIVERFTGQQIVKHKIHCPLHSDNDPSMHIYEDGCFKCFQCGVSGDLLTFVGYYHFKNQYNPAIHFTQVVDLIGSLNIAPLVQRNEAHKPAQKPKERLSIALDDIYQWHEKMPAERREYWHSRYLTDSTVDRFMLGWDGYRYTIPHLYRLIPFGVKRRICPNDFTVKMNQRQRAIETLKAEHPEFDEKQIEKLAPDKPVKYVSVKNSRSGIFNADILAAAHEVVICEGEIDAMLLDQCGFPAVSPTAGAGTWMPEWANLFSSVRRIWILYDNDKAGMDGAKQVWSTLRRAKIVQYPAGVKDAGELFDQAGTNPIRWLDGVLK